MAEEVIGNDPRSEAPDTKTLRDQVILAIQDRLINDTPFDPDDPRDLKLFDNVIRGTLDDIEPAMTPACAIEEGDETITNNLYACLDKRFRIYVNFKVIKRQGVDVYSLVNYYFGRVVQTLVRPEEEGLHLADLTISVEEAGNSIQYNGATDPEPGGIAIFDIVIRHQLGNPFVE